MTARTILPLLFLSLLGACQPPNESPEPAGTSKLRFVFGNPQGSAWPDTVKAPMTQVAVSYETAQGQAVSRVRLAVASTATGYQTEALTVPSGTYRITELFVLDALDQAYGVLPSADSYYGETGALVRTVPFNVKLSGGEKADAVEFSSVAVYTVPADYGYADFPAPRSVPAMDFSYRVFDESGNLIPSFVQEESLRTTSGGKSSTAYWGNNPLGTPEVRTLYEGLKLADPAGYQATNQTVYVKLKVGSYGYEDSPTLYYFPGDLDARRQSDPVVDVVLRSEASLVKLTPAGTNEAGLHVVKARLDASQFLEREQTLAGAAPEDKYSYTVGFTLGSHKSKVINGKTGWVSAPLLKSPAPGPLSTTFYMAPYNSAAAQSRDAYRTLEADLVVKDEAAWTELNDPAVPKTMQVYVEMLVLKGDGTGVINGGEAFVTFKTKVIKIGPQQIGWDE